MLGRFLRWLLGPPKVVVEVNINVPEIHVFTHGSGKNSEKADIAEHRSGSHDNQEGFIKSPPAVTDEERLQDFEDKFENFKTPEVNLGQDQTNK
jgi:hypothetical protein